MCNTRETIPHTGFWDLVVVGGYEISGSDWLNVPAVGVGEGRGRSLRRKQVKENKEAGKGH